MSRILLADDSPHAQRMGERILRDEGHEVISVSDGRTAMLRLDDASPDLIIADVSMPEVTGYELCEYVKSHGGAPVFLTVGAVEPFDKAEGLRVGADGVLKKPFEATLLLAAVGRFVAPGKRAVTVEQREQRPGAVQPPPAPPRSLAVLDPEQVRAAVTVALDMAMPALIDKVTEQVIGALSHRKRDVT
jgi:CheY-like chemotaxis protein